MSLSDAYEQKLGDLILRSQAAFKPAAVAVSLHTADPTDDRATALANELPNSGGYARVAVPQLDANWTPPVGNNGVFTNNIVIAFPAPTADQGTATHFALWDSATYGSGVLIGSGILTAPKVISNGDPATNFPVGSLRVTVS